MRENFPLGFPSRCAFREAYSLRRACENPPLRVMPALRYVYERQAGACCP